MVVTLSDFRIPLYTCKPGKQWTGKHIGKKLMGWGRKNKTKQETSKKKKHSSSNSKIKSKNKDKGQVCAQSFLAIISVCP